MARISIAAACAALAMLVLAPSAAMAQPRTGTIYHTVQLPIRSGQLETVKVTCPPGTEAVAGSTFPLPLDVTLLRSVRRGRERIFLLEPAGYGATTVTLVVTCVRRFVVVRGGGGLFNFALGIRTRYRTITVKRNVPIKVKVKCPKGSAPLGPDLRVESGATGKSLPRAAVAPGTPDVRLVRSMPLHGGWDYELYEAQEEETSLRVGVTCGRRSATARSRGRVLRERIRVIRRLMSESVPPGLTPHQVTCPRGTTPLSPGHAFADADQLDLLTLIGAHPSQKKDAVDFLIAKASAEASAKVDAELAALCMKARRTVFSERGSVE